MSDTYNQEVYCTNCDFGGPIDIPKGQVVENTACPNCGNMTLKKRPKPVRLIPHIESYR